MKIRGFIFDLDGVLTDTAEYHFQAWRRLAEEEGILFTRQDNEALRGVSRRESLNLLLKGRPVSDEQAEEMMRRKNGYYVALIEAMGADEVLPGAVELLLELRQAGLKIAIASASKNAGQVIDRLGLRERVDVLCDGFSVAAPKPAPDLFVYAAERLGFSPGECVVVEDAEAGIQAAHAAGMRAVGLGPVQRVGAAEVVLPDLSHARLADLLERLA